MPSWRPWSRAGAGRVVRGGPSSQLLNSCRDPAAASRRRDAARPGRLPASSSLGGSASAPCTLPADRDRGSGRGNAELAGDAGLARGSWLLPLAHHCSSSSSSMGRRPRRIGALLLPEPRDQLRKVAAPICGHVFLIRPLVRGKVVGGVGGGASERRRGKGERRRRRKEKGYWVSWCRGSERAGWAPAG